MSFQTDLRIFFTPESQDVTEDIRDDILAFSYEDRDGDEADEISLTLKDQTGKWAGRWRPDGGETVRATLGIKTLDGIAIGNALRCGTFYVDSMSASGSPRVFQLRAIAIPLRSNLRRRRVTKAWEDKTLKGIASEIAKSAGVELLFESEDDPRYDRQDQKDESNLRFLARLCSDAGKSVKVTDEMLVIFDQETYEKKPPVATIALGVSDLRSWSFESQQSETYKTCTVSWRDYRKKTPTSAGGYDIDVAKAKALADDGYDIDAVPKAKDNAAVMTYTYVDPDVDDNGQDLKLKKRAKTIEEAKRLAKAELRKHNLRRLTGSLTLAGNPSIVAGVVIECKGFGAFDGNFLVESASHSVTNSGYTTSIQVRAVNRKY